MPARLDDMFYEFALTIPASTLVTAPLEDTVEISTGRIVGVEIQFPRGCVTLVHVRVRRESHPLWPSNTDGDIAGEGANIRFIDDYALDQPPFHLTLVGWNDDDTFPHTIRFRFNVLPLTAPPAALAPPSPLPAPIESFLIDV